MDAKPIIEKAADNFFLRYDGSKGGGSIQSQYDNHDYQAQLQSEVYKFKRVEDKLIFLNRSIVAVEKEKEKDNKGGFIRSYYDGIIYFIQQEMDELNEKEGSSPEYFTPQERVDIIESIEELKRTTLTGQEVLFNEIEELKNQLHQKKKTFYEVAKGKIFSFAVDKVTDPETLGKIYHKLINETLPNLLQQ